ncbi:MAG: hypothetical protein PVH98_09040 [Gammaproteobacteria bacterium]
MISSNIFYLPLHTFIDARNPAPYINLAINLHSHTLAGQVTDDVIDLITTEYHRG